MPEKVHKEVVKEVDRDGQDKPPGQILSFLQQRERGKGGESRGGSIVPEVDVLDDEKRVGPEGGD